MFQRNFVTGLQRPGPPGAGAEVKHLHSISWSVHINPDLSLNRVMGFAMITQSSLYIPLTDHKSHLSQLEMDRDGYGVAANLERFPNGRQGTRSDIPMQEMLIAGARNQLVLLFKAIDLLLLRKNPVTP